MPLSGARTPAPVGIDLGFSWPLSLEGGPESANRLRPSESLSGWPRKAGEVGPEADPAAVGRERHAGLARRLNEVQALPEETSLRSSTLLVYVCFSWLFASADNLDPLALLPNTPLPTLPCLSVSLSFLSAPPIFLSPLSLTFLSLSSHRSLCPPFPTALPLFMFAPPGHFLFIVL